MTSARRKEQEGKLEDMLRKVRALLEQADHPNTTPVEADTFRSHAELLMFRYRIDESMLAEEPEAEIECVWNRLVIPSGTWRQYFSAMAKYAVEHVGARGVLGVTRMDMDGLQNVSTWNLHYVGYPSDIRLADALYTSCMIAFSKRLDPKVDPELTEQENAYWLRKGGMEGWRIATLLWPEVELVYVRNSWQRRPPDKYVYKARKLFKLEALKRGEDPSELLGQGNSMSVYRSSYAEGFLTEIRMRMMRMRQARDGSGELVLAGRRQRIDEAFYTEYPQYRPMERLAGGEDDEDGEEEGEGGVARDHTRSAYSDPRSGCERCRKAKSGYCREHSYLRPRAYREEPYSRAGAAAGRRAARDVDLGGSDGRALS